MFKSFNISTAQQLSTVTRSVGLDLCDQRRPLHNHVLEKKQGGTEIMHRL